jgi:hypothetical protein
MLSRSAAGEGDDGRIGLAMRTVMVDDELKP